MKKYFTLSLATLLFGSFFLLSYIDGPANGGSIAATGEPGSVTTCVTCHGSGRSVEVEIIVLSDSGDTVDTYIPGEDYTAKVLIEGVAWFPEGFGFQMVSLLDDNSDVDGWSDPGSNVQITQLASRSYAEHSFPKAIGDFDVKWTAPMAGSGEVTFYAGGNGVNRNNSNSGDGANLATLKLAESTSTSTLEHENRTISIYPNPTADYLTIDMDLIGETEARIFIHDMQGKEVYVRKLYTAGNRLNEQIYLGDFRPATYLLTVQTRTQSMTKTFVRL